MRRTPILALLVIACVTSALYFAMRGDDILPIPASGLDAAVESTPDTDASRGATIANGANADPQDDEGSPSRESVAVAPPLLATIRGRCVEETGAPIAGAAVALHGWGRSEFRVQSYRLDHGDVVWTDPSPVFTGSDGRFELRFAPPPPYQFTCQAGAEGRVSVFGRWIEIARDADLDLGDVALLPGVNVSGRVIDESGIGVPGRMVRLRRQASASPTQVQVPRESDLGVTDTGGFFAMRFLLPPGRYELDAQDLILIEPGPSIELGRANTELQIVVRVPPPDERPTIEGVVVDARGRAVADAQVLVGDDWYSGPRTDPDGTFVYRQDDRSPRTPIELGVAADGFVSWRTTELVEWGTHDLRIALDDGSPLSVRVRRADDDSPVERYGIILAPIRPHSGWSSNDDRLRHLGMHPDGVLEIARVSPGRYRLAVVPTESTGLRRSLGQEIEIEPGLAKLLEVRIVADVDRVVEVVTKNGDPVQGVLVELLMHRTGGELSLLTPARKIQQFRGPSLDHYAVLVAEGRTDANGSLMLRGPVEGTLGLRLPGPGHVPLLVTPFRMSDEEPARVVVGVGGKLVGRIEPAGLVGSLREGAGLPAGGPVEPGRASLLPCVGLHRDGPGGAEAFPIGRLDQGMPLDHGGTFEISGIPSGTWELIISWQRSEVREGRSIGVGSASRVARSGIAITEGETREIVMDLAGWLDRSVTIRARLDGEPIRGELQLAGVFAGSNAGLPQRTQRSMRLDGEGEVVVGLPAASYQSSVQVHIGDVQVPLVGPAFVIPETEPGNAGASVDVDIDLSLGRCAVLVLDVDGKPVADLELHAAGGEPTPRYYSTGKTDAAGRAVLLGPIGRTPFRTRRLPLAHEPSFWAWVSKQPDSNAAQSLAWVDLGIFDLVPGALDTPRTVRLPAEWAELPDAR